MNKGLEANAGTGLGTKSSTLMRALSVCTDGGARVNRRVTGLRNPPSEQGGRMKELLCGAMSGCGPRRRFARHRLVAVPGEPGARQSGLARSEERRVGK